MAQAILLGDISDINMGQSPKSEHYNNSGEGIPFLQGVRTFGSLYPIIDTWCTKPVKIADKGDLLFSVRAPVGDLNFAPTKICIGRGLASIKSRNNKYLYYLLKANIQRLINYQTGSIFGSVSAGMLKNFKVNVHCDSEQDRIADILGTLDEKIELNRQMNETLEQIGQALFRHYFIDNPEAKKWEKISLNDLCTRATSGGTPSTVIEEYYDGDVQWYSTKELRDNFLFFSEKTITKFGLSKSSAKLFPKNTVLMAIYAAPTVGRLGILTSEASFNQATCGLVARSDIGYEFIYLLLLYSRAELNNMANGAAQQNISVGKVRNFKVFNPDVRLIAEFRSQVEHIFTQIESNSRETQTLTILRDTLLPRLISGKVKV